MTRKKRRIVGLVVGGIILLCATGLVVFGLRDSLVFFVTPTELLEKKPDHQVRIGGMVEAGSVRQNENTITEFIVTDFETSVPVRYKGVLPDLFREGQGVVAQGTYTNGYFDAAEILAKHDEDYMPSEVKDMLENKKGVE